MVGPHLSAAYAMSVIQANDDEKDIKDICGCGLIRFAARTINIFIKKLLVRVFLEKISSEVVLNKSANLKKGCITMA